MTKKQLAVITVLTVAIILLGLLISRRLWFRADLTRNRAYTISRASRRLYTEIPDQVRITYYLSDKLKAIYPQPGEILDLLREYAAYSRGKIQVAVKDPVKTGLANAVERLGIQPNQINTMEEDQNSRITVYTGIAVEYMDAAEVLPVVFSLDTLEYDLTSRIRALVRGTKREIGVILGSAQRSWEEDYRSFNQFFTQSGYALRIIPPGSEIPDTLPALFVLGGTEDLGGWELYRIDRYIQGGGKTLFLPEAVRVNLQGGGEPQVMTDKGLLAMLSGYGASVQPALTLDKTALPLSYQRPTEYGIAFVEQVKYPHWIAVLETSGNKDNPLTVNFTGLDLFWANPLELNPPESVEAQTLFTTTKDAWLMTKDFTIDYRGPPYLFEREAQETRGVKILGAALRGKFPSYFSGTEKPVREGSAEELPDMPAEPKETRIIVIGSGEFASHSYEYTSSVRDLNFLLAAADWLSNDDDIVSIRNRQGLRQLDKITDERKRAQAMAFARSFNVILVPLAVIAAGISAALKRRRRANIQGR
ncbi:MAG: GldG family protein [Spirochaetaceae bacterium]|nr:GldG family protein [Spirochaetaceae bacterium]